MKEINEVVLSPISGSPNIRILKNYNSSTLIKDYQDLFNIDIEYLFNGTTKISLYECLDTGYKFYYPFYIAGDDKFYAHFGKFDWYYIPWKWEHQQCANLVKDGDTLLEVGAGKGDFISNLSKIRNIQALGLELNNEAIQVIDGTNIKLINQSIEEHSMNKNDQYDIVCSFQVLEHIAKVNDTLLAMVRCLKPKGKLLISVPNNDGFIGSNILPSQILNRPPHHMGLWNHESLQNLCDHYPIRLKEIIIEPLQPIHYDTYLYNLIYKLFNNGFLSRVIWKLKLNIILRAFLKLFVKNITGHSIIAVYEKD